MFRYLRFNFCIVLILFTFTTLPVSAQQGFGISPSIQEVEADIDRSYDIDYIIENNTEQETLTTEISIETFQEGSIEGSANIIPFPEDKDFSSWLTVPKSLSITKNIPTKVSYQLNVPKDTKAGAYFFAIVYKPVQNNIDTQNQGNKLILESRIATLLFVNVGGDTSKQAIIENFKTSPKIIDPMFDRLEVSYDVLVQGSSFYRPTGNIFLASNSEDNITTLDTISSEKLILPNGKRSYNNCFQSKLVLKSCDDKAPNPIPYIGKEKLTLRLDFTNSDGTPQSVLTEKDVVIFPYKVLILIVLLLISLYGLYLLIKILITKKPSHD
jgi:hypothetical protein